MSGADRDRFLELGIRTVIDLRYPWEIEAKGRTPQPERFADANLGIEHRPYDQAAVDPAVDPWRYLADRFAEVTEDGAEGIRRVIALIADGPGRRRPGPRPAGGPRRGDPGRPHHPLRLPGPLPHRHRRHHPGRRRPAARPPADVAPHRRGVGGGAGKPRAPPAAALVDSPHAPPTERRVPVAERREGEPPCARTAPPPFPRPGTT
ncbi:tyrosine-protein phosphatase [Streptomyces sp. NPDC048507]|uniref:tyrosine-protein phosphatase n=1 Tax=Streptomyces sp. NPDC048507 TaxID=3365560 RepID=UPI00371EF4DB